MLAACGAGRQAVAGRGAGIGSRAAALAEQRQDNAEAARAVAALQRRYGAGGYRATRSWQSANALDATIDYMRASGSPDFLADLNETFRAHHGRDNFLNGYYDDEGWWALTWINAYDLTGNAAYLGQAKDIFADMTGGWDGTCGGGIWWSKARHYKNAIANELFLQVAVALHERAPGDTFYANWAQREWAWFQGSGMLTGSHLVIDGLAACQAGPELADLDLQPGRPHRRAGGAGPDDRQPGAAGHRPGGSPARSWTARRSARTASCATRASRRPATRTSRCSRASS